MGDVIASLFSVLYVAALRNSRCWICGTLNVFLGAAFLLLDGIQAVVLGVVVADEKKSERSPSTRFLPSTAAVDDSAV